MSKNFDFKRLGKLLRWTLVTDRPYSIKCLGMYVGMIGIMFQMLNLHYAMGDYQGGIHFIYAISVFMPLAVLAFGGSYFVVSYAYWKDGIRELIMLPASRFEKFIVRYLVPIIIQLCCLLVAFVVADVLQYLVGLIIGREPLEWMMPKIVTWYQRFNIDGSAIVFAIGIFWVNTLYLLGANFFRNLKYNWVVTTVVLLVIFIAVMMLLPSGMYDKGRITAQFFKQWSTILCIVLLATGCLNIWLAFRLFSSRPLIGKYINKL